MSLHPLNLMGVIVESMPIGQASVKIDLGDMQGTLRLSARHETDRYRHVRLQWHDPLTRVWVDLGRGLLDTATGEMLPHDIDTSTQEFKTRPRNRRKQVEA
jgi:hypothetical protein